jgi:L-alanine-DL-glutamate epimerase-like enolase superfamily enzyme
VTLRAAEYERVPALKIIDLKCVVIASSPVLRITTDEGITGWSQIEAPKSFVQPQVLSLKDWITGQDPRVTSSA